MSIYYSTHARNLNQLSRTRNNPAADPAVTRPDGTRGGSPDGVRPARGGVIAGPRVPGTPQGGIFFRGKGAFSALIDHFPENAPGAAVFSVRRAGASAGVHVFAKAAFAAGACFTAARARLPRRLRSLFRPAGRAGRGVRRPLPASGRPARPHRPRYICWKTGFPFLIVAMGTISFLMAREPP